MAEFFQSGHKFFHNYAKLDVSLVHFFTFSFLLTRTRILASITSCTAKCTLEIIAASAEASLPNFSILYSVLNVGKYKFDILSVEFSTNDLSESVVNIGRSINHR